MITFSSNIDFDLQNKQQFITWITNTILNENFFIGNINYTFCSDDQLLKINKNYLDHDYYTDIITFNSVNFNKVNSDIFISIDRVRDNAFSRNIHFDTELLRVIIHGILHLCNYDDKDENSKSIMRSKENFYINEFHKISQE